MERKRPKTTAKSSTSSPPRSTKAGQAGAQCVPDIVTRTFDLVTSKVVIPFYILAGVFSFHYVPKSASMPSPRPLDFVVFNVLPLVYLMELVRHPPQTICPFHDHARRYILLGLVVCSIGDGLVAYRPDVYLVYWFGTTCIGYFFYAIAFYQYYKPSKWAKILIPVNLILAASLIYVVKDLTLSGLIVIFTFFLTALGFFALTRLETCRTGPGYLGWAGVKLFILSNFMFALNMLVPSMGRPISDTVITMSYYLGQLGIALSTYTIKLCPAEQPSTSSPGLTSDSSASLI